MIVIEIDQNSLTVNGHAGYAEAGKDIVCAASGMLRKTLWWFLIIHSSSQGSRRAHTRDWLVCAKDRETPEAAPVGEAASGVSALTIQF